jgi:hypothetical protein
MGIELLQLNRLGRVFPDRRRLHADLCSLREEDHRGGVLVSFMPVASLLVLLEWGTVSQVRESLAEGLREENAMGLFDKLRGSSAVTFNPQQALMTIVVAAVKADGHVSEDEIRRIRSLCLLNPRLKRTCVVCGKTKDVLREPADSLSALPTHVALANGRFRSVTLNDTHKDHEHAQSRIEAFHALDRDIETLTYTLYEASPRSGASVGCLSPETQRDYVNMLVAMLNRAKEQCVIPRGGKRVSVS